MPTTCSIITRGTRAQAAEAVAIWNATADLVDDGPATLRFRPALGWVATVTSWA